MVTVIHLAVVLFIIIAGLTKANASNMQPFLLEGPRGIFNGAALVLIQSTHTHMTSPTWLQYQPQHVHCPYCLGDQADELVTLVCATVAGVLQLYRF